MLQIASTAAPSQNHQGTHKNNPPESAETTGGKLEKKESKISGRLVHFTLQLKKLIFQIRRAQHVKQIPNSQEFS